MLAAHPELRGRPAAAALRLERTARRNAQNFEGPNDPLDVGPGYDGTPCATGFCHADHRDPIEFAAAYGAGIVDGAAAAR
jgi:hypothetical protein